MSEQTVRRKEGGIKDSKNKMLIMIIRCYSSLEWHVRAPPAGLAVLSDIFAHRHVLSGCDTRKAIGKVNRLPASFRGEKQFVGDHGIHRLIAGVPDGPSRIAH